MFTVRPIQKSDINAFHKALNSVVSERKYLLTLEPPSIEGITRFVCDNIEHNHAQYVAEIQGKVIGWADIIPKHKTALRHTGELGMGVVASQRGQGIGRILLENVINHAWHKGLTRIELEVFANNPAAISLYKKCGFEHEGTKRNARLIDGIYQDAHIMAQCRI